MASEDVAPLLFFVVDAVMEEYKTLIWRRHPHHDTTEDWRRFKIESDDGDARLGWWRLTW